MQGGEKAMRSVIPVGNQRAMIKDSLDLQCTVNDIVRLRQRAGSTGRTVNDGRRSTECNRIMDGYNTTAQPIYPHYPQVVSYERRRNILTDNHFRRCRRSRNS